ncbi:hypothetical protein [Humidisolicoccus flavus]|uniref:hypothetical protein n=1 Tax=Humidisolicoccus flavus TaxID=3111414 RepID=UPI003248A1EB
MQPNRFTRPLSARGLRKLSIVVAFVTAFFLYAAVAVFVVGLQRGFDAEVWVPMRGNAASQAGFATAIYAALAIVGMIGVYQLRSLAKQTDERTKSADSTPTS